MKKKDKNKFVAVIIIGLFMLIVYLFTRSGATFFSFVPTTTMNDRAISLFNAWTYDGYHDSVTVVNNFEFFTKTGSKYDSVVSQRPQSLYASYNMIIGKSNTDSHWSTLNSHENWFIHADGTDTSNLDNRIRDISYGFFKMDISNIIYGQYNYETIIQPELASANTIFYDNAFADFRNEPVWHHVSNEAAVVNGNTVSVSKDLFEPRRPFMVFNNISVSVRSDGQGENLYGDSYNGRVISLSDNVTLSEVDTNLTNNGEFDQWTSFTHICYPDNVKPANWGTPITVQGVPTASANRVSRVSDGAGFVLQFYTRANVSQFYRSVRTDPILYDNNYDYIARVRVKSVDSTYSVRFGVEFGDTSNWGYEPKYNSVQPYWPVESTVVLPGQESEITLFIPKYTWYKDYMSIFVRTNTNTIQLLNYELLKLGEEQTIVYVSYGAVATAPLFYINGIHTNTKAYLQYLKSRLPAGKKLIFNELELPTQNNPGNIDYLEFSDGVMVEKFNHAYWQNNTYNQSETDWLNYMNVINMEVINKSKIALLMCGIGLNATEQRKKEVFDFCFPSFLLLQNKGQVMFQYTIDDDRHNWYWQEYDYNYGEPLEDFKAYNDNPKIYGRKYTNGFVLVNPTAQQGTFNFDKYYKNFDGVEINSVVVPAKSGLYVFEINSTTEVPSASKPLISDAKTLFIGICIALVVVMLFSYKKKLKI